MTIDLRQSLTRAARRAGDASSDFDLNPDVVLHEGRMLRPAAVLVPVTDRGEVILTKRSARLKHHPGQIALPGGRQDPEDATLEAAALRETEEEIGLPRSGVEILGALPPHETVTGYTVAPFLALVDGAAPLRPEEGEVAEIFRVPLAHVTDPDRFRVEARLWRRQWRHYYTVPFGPYYIWGATARILRGLAERMVA
ncbi:MAG: CoA pyrophosphatase [Salibaculum sp.]|uniref:CoA pyrophosphatase n=1 Tax=Roseovarius halophilus (ex Wu et al. 2025) TaxID=3376060 RepID=UPI00286FDE18|nr:CoA pyrophosphatase [Salibaculum sp.]MDR9426803.1 CoA pyrophosphatase [Salibaculum sp.]MDR9481359.1 CoA pyrophosphatase [Salibaculum sp.]